MAELHHPGIRSDLLEDEVDSIPVDVGLENVNRCLDAATNGLNFDIAELWRFPPEEPMWDTTTNSATGKVMRRVNQNVEVESAVTATPEVTTVRHWQEPVCDHVYKMNAKVKMYTARPVGIWSSGYENSKASRDHLVSPGYCRQARISECPLWFTTATSRPLTPPLPHKTVVVLPVHLDAELEHEDKETFKKGEYFAVFLSLTRLERNTVALEFLTQISKAATILFLKHRMKSEDTQRTTEPSREGYVDDLPVVVHPGVRPKTDVAWTDLSDVAFLVNGGSCVIYTAWYKEQKVVVKMVRKDVQGADVNRRELEVELAVMLRIRHKNIARLVGAGNEPERFLLISRLGGGTLSQRCGLGHNLRRGQSTINTSKRPFTYIEMLRCARQLAEALTYLHEEAIPGKMVIHRDVKPDNIGFTAEGDLKLLDLGLAKVVTKSEMMDTVYHLTGGMGSYRYMAPEVAESRPYNEKVDVYSYGLVLWQMATLKKPFEDMPLNVFLEKVTRGSHQPLMTSDWPKSLSDLLKSCWSDKITERPSFAQVGALLQGMLQEGIDRNWVQMSLPTIGDWRRRLGIRNRHSSWC